MTTILATDLDGTFLGGSDAERAALYEWILRHRRDLVLIYVTGRSLTTMQDVLDGLPLLPDHVIANVGTSAHAAPDWRGHASVEDGLDLTWCPHRAREVDATLRDRFPRLEPQPIVEGRRLSYFYDAATPMAELVSHVQGLGFDALPSAGRYFDVLPRGVNKGSTLLRLLDALGLPRERTLVAGDTLNDLALFETGLRGVAVRDSEPSLLAALGGLPNTEHAAEPGAAAILPRLRAMQAELAQVTA